MKKRIYLSGAMAGVSYEEQSAWRSQIINLIHLKTSRISFFNPLNYFTYEEPVHKTEKQIMNFELNAIRNSDLVIVNFNEHKSVGTTCELAIAYEHRIPIIGLNNNNVYKLHPWHIEMCDVIFDNAVELTDYVYYYYLSSQ